MPYFDGKKFLNSISSKKILETSQEQIKYYMDKSVKESYLEYLRKNKKKNVVLIGLGPHAKRIYLNYFKKHKTNLALLVELESKKTSVRQYLDENIFKNTKIFTLPDHLKDDEHLPSDVSSNLLAVCKTLEITHIIIATEPKAHNMYVEFALKNNYDVLTDKPITVGKNMTSISSINKIRKQYYDLLKLEENSRASCKVMCQRQYHKGYEYIKNLISDAVNKYQVPITYIDIFHCDGNWEMPHDLLKENHPYKYGYGKLFHSGYHFIDLLSDFIKINDQLTGTKKIKKGEVYSNFFTPNDELNIFNIDDYKRVFKEQNIPEYYQKNKKIKFDKFGEKNFYGSLDFRNKYNQLITHVNLNLLHYGFSRRAWIESKDYYKHNGRIRHEYINIEIGTLMNIQVHSYQSKEIKDRTNDMSIEEQVGGLEHFDIDIYRNSDLIGGKPFERVKLGDLYTEKEKKDILGYNELSREVYLTKFLNGTCKKGDLKDQALGIEILYSCAMGLHNHYDNIKESVPIDVRNNYTYPINISNLKKYCHPVRSDDEVEGRKDIKYIILPDKEGYDIGIWLCYYPKLSIYDSWIYITNNDGIASGLLHKEFSNMHLAKLYFYYLKYICSHKKIAKIVRMIENKGL